MDRRHFIAGSAAAAAAPHHPARLRRRTLIRRTRSPSSIRFRPAAPPTWSAARLRPCSSRSSSSRCVIETKAGAAGAVGAQFAANAKPDGYTLLIHITSISGFAEVDKLFGRTPKFTRADFIPIARLTSPIRGAASSTTSSPTRRSRIWSTTPRSVRTRSSSQFVGTLRRAAYSDRAVHEGGRHLSCAICRPMAAGRRSRRSSATTAQVLVSSIVGLRSRRSRPARRSRSPVRRQALEGAARRADPEGARLRRRILSLGRPVRAEGHAGQRSSLVCATSINKAAHTDQFKTAMANLGQDVDYLDQPEFAKFWDADAARIEAAVRQIGRCKDNGANAPHF